MSKIKMVFRIETICLLFSLSISLAACSLGISAPRVTQEEIVGVWTEESCATDTPENSTCGSLEFFSDGRFEAHNIPTTNFILAYYGLLRADASGSWELDTPTQDPFDYQEVNLVFDTYGASEGMYISSLGNNLFITAGIEGETGNTFVKEH